MKISLKNILATALLLVPACGFAQWGQTPPLHVDGTHLKDPHGNTVVLHGFMDTPNTYFNDGRWTASNGYTSSAVTPCLNYFEKLFTAATDTASGAYANLFRLHLDPCWTNELNTTSTGESDISNFSSTRLRTYLRSLFYPLARRAINHGMYVIMRPPGVFPETVQVGDEYNDYLLTVWDIVTQNDSIKKYSGQIMLELGNEPVNVLNADGESDDPNTLHDFFQPIVDKIRQNGYTGIIWLPGTGYQSIYTNYSQVPVEGYNIGYAVHNYVGWYGADDTKTVADSTAYFEKFLSMVPVVETNPVVITEFDWSPESDAEGHYDEDGDWVAGNLGSWSTGTTSHWGNLFKALLDHFGNISCTLSGTGVYLDIDEYIDNGVVQPAFAGEEEACGEACWQWYQEYAQVNQPRPDYTRQWSADNGYGSFANPLINADFPDPDVILVDDTYYLATTTMYLFPGVTLLKSKDLINWEYCANPLQKISDSDPYNLENGLNKYSGGQWAPTLNYHNGKFYLYFIAFDSDGYEDGGGFMLSATDPEGDWDMEEIGFYYDSGFLFDDSRDYLSGLAEDGTANGTGNIYVVSGINTFTVTQLDNDFNEVKSEVVLTPDNGCEGSHFYHIGTYYYIYSTYGGTEQSQTIFRATDPFGPYEEHDGRIFANQAIHQGGIVRTQEGEWWTILFKDAGAVGRIPYLEPVTWSDGWPTLGNDGIDVSKDKAYYTKPNVGTSYQRTYLPTNDTFTDSSLGLQWQWSHNPDNTAWSLFENPGYLRLHTSSITDSLKAARNTLTQRMFAYNQEGTSSDGYMDTYGTISVDLSGMVDGDIAGLTIFQDPYAYIGVRMQDGQKQLFYYYSDYDGVEREEVDGPVVTSDQIYLRAVANFGTSEARFYYSYDNATWTQVGNEWTMSYTLNVFVGNRFGIFNYATKQLGGYIDVDWFSTEPEYTEEKYFADGTLTTYTEADLTMTSLTMDADSYTLTPGSYKTLEIMATMESGATQNVASQCSYTITDESVATIVSGRIVAQSPGETEITATYTDVVGNTGSLTFTVTVDYFPLTTDAFNASISGEGTFRLISGIGSLTTAEDGFGGWEYTSGVDLSAYNYIVVKLRRTATCSPTFSLFDENNYWSTPYTVDLTGQTTAVIDLHNMEKEDGTMCDPSHLYIIGFGSSGSSAIYITDVYLSDDGENVTAVESVSAQVGGCRYEYFTLDGRKVSSLQRGVTIVRVTNADGSQQTMKVINND